MSSLYELTAEWQELMMWAEDPDVDEQVFMDTVEGLNGEIEEKADGYAKLIKQLEYDAEACSKEAQRFTEKKKHLENKVKRLKESLKNAMELTGKTKFKTNLFSFNVQKNPPTVAVDADLKDIPEEYLRWADPVVDKTKIKEALKSGVVLDGIAHLNQTTSVRIK